MSLFNTSLVWFRRDLRTFDQAALHEALSLSATVHCVFIFDREILDPLQAQANKADRRVDFIHQSLAELDAELRMHGGGLIVRHAHASTEIPLLAAQLGVQAVFINEDYEPAAVARDAAVAGALMADGRRLILCKDQVIFEKSEVLTQAGRPYSVFTPYKNAWMKTLMAAADPHADHPLLHKYAAAPDYRRLAAAPAGMPSLADIGFETSDLASLGIAAGMTGGQDLIDEFMDRIRDYDTARNFPAVRGTSHLSVHLRFGTVSVRALARRALQAMHNGEGGQGAAVWLSELIWRDFYFSILHHFPHVATQAFRPEYDRISWETGAHADQAYQAWCEGRTGYPLVDAAMLQLNRTGFMHNRLRMVAACFLVKDLGIDYRRGERYFAEKLNDFDLSANNGGWQWAASSGCDAQPWFRIFNPVTQSEKFDADGAFIRRWLPQLARLDAKDIHAPWKASPAALKKAGVTLGEHYPLPLVRHEEARELTLQRYAVVKKAKATEEAA